MLVSGKSYNYGKSEKAKLAKERYLESIRHFPVYQSALRNSLFNRMPLLVGCYGLFEREMKRKTDSEKATEKTRKKNRSTYQLSSEPRINASFHLTNPSSAFTRTSVPDPVPCLV